MNELIINASIQDILRKVRFDWTCCYSEYVKEIIVVNLN